MSSNNKIMIIVDSTCDLTDEIIKKNNLKVIPLKVIFNEEVYEDGINLTSDQLYQKIEELNILPKTAAIGIMEFLEIFQKAQKDGYDIISFSVSSKISSTYQNAVIASQDESIDPKRIRVIDTLSLSSGEGIQIMRACKLREQNKTIQEIFEDNERIKLKVNTSFAIEAMEYLYKGGRCSGLAYFFGSVLKIKPIIKMYEGKLIVGEKPRGHIKKALDILVNHIIAQKDKLDDDYVFITHTYAEESEKYIRSALEGKINVKNLITTNAGSTISSHCGKGTIGILFLVND